MLTTPLTWASAAGPITLLAISLWPMAAQVRSSSVCRVANAACGANLALALGTLATAFFIGGLRTQTLGLGGVGIGLYIDALSATMFVLVAFVGLIVVAYSGNYLDGDPRQVRFVRLLCGTLSAVLLIVICGNLLQLLIAWIATSIGLHHLLLFYPERQAAVFAVRKRNVAARLGELCLLVAILIAYRWFHTLDYGAIVNRPYGGSTAGLPQSLQIMSLLIVFAGVLKSGQFPLHGWLTEVMEAPTPVSALLHAGIVNAGGFLVLRFSHLIGSSLPSLGTLAVIGGFTALFGSVVMLTQSSIKGALAYSTIAQMGFMMLECGLAVFPAALLHIIAHSLYKAHAFLSSGSILDIARSSWTPSPGGRPHPARQLIAIVAVLAVVTLVAPIFHFSLSAQPGLFALGAIVALGVVVLVANALDERPSGYVIGLTAIYAALIVGAYFVLQVIMQRIFSGLLVSSGALHGWLAITVACLVIAAFAFVTFFQGLLPGTAGRWGAAYAHVRNGLYVNTLMNRLLLRLWPPAIAPLERGTPR